MDRSMKAMKDIQTVASIVLSLGNYSEIVFISFSDGKVEAFQEVEEVKCYVLPSIIAKYVAK